MPLRVHRSPCLETPPKHTCLVLSNRRSTSLFTEPLAPDRLSASRSVRDPALLIAPGGTEDTQSHFSFNHNAHHRGLDAFFNGGLDAFFNGARAEERLKERSV